MNFDPEKFEPPKNIDRKYFWLGLVEWVGLQCWLSWSGWVDLDIGWLSRVSNTF